MPSYDPSLFNVRPYYDDYEEDKKFLRMLFRPGYAVQTRELTQLQTILQNQIERFGNNIFRDGSRIIGGNISTQTLNFVRLLPQSSSVPLFNLAEQDIVGFNLIQRDGSGNVVSKAKVLDFLPPAGDDDNFVVAVISYMSGTEFSASTSLESDNPDKFFNVTTAPDSQTLPYKGRCRVVATGEGIYYANGFFVRTSDQIEPAYTVVDGVRTFTAPSGSMGFRVVSMIVTEKDDYTLKDPASGSYNYNAPGAHRYKVDMVLSFVETDSEKDFVELVRYQNGTVVRKFDQTQYSDLMNLFAQRTYDEKGNYVVKPFDITFKDSTDASSVVAEIGSGKAYVFGHEYESRFKEQIEVPKARTITEYQDMGVSNYFGNYILGKYNPVASGTNIAPLFSLPSQLRGERSLSVEVYGATQPLTAQEFLANGYANTLFSGILHRLDTDDPTVNSTQGATMQFRAYLSSVENIKFGTTVGLPINLYMIDPVTRISTKLLSDITRDAANSAVPKFHDFASQSLVYPLNGNTPTTMIANVDSVSYVHDVSRTFVVSAANPFPEVELGLGNEYNWCFEAANIGQGFVPDGNDVVLDSEDGYYVVSESPSLPPTNANYLAPGTILKIVGQSAQIPSGQSVARAKISGSGDFVVFTSQLPPGGYRLVGKVKAVSTNLQGVSVDTSKIRTKTLVQTSETITNTTSQSNVSKRIIRRNSANGIYEMYFTLNKADVHRIVSIQDGSGNDISHRFQFDNGQRDSAYLLARLFVKPNFFSTYEETKTFQFTVTYTNFDHSGYGPFVRDSYLGLSYDQIPVYTDPHTGNSVHLANAVDYRPIAKIIGFYSGNTLGSSGSSVPNQYNRPLINYSNGFAPIQSSIASDHDAYLPRIDKIVVSRNIAADGEVTTLQRVGGIASDSPVVPEDTSDSMTLFVLSVPAYTFNPTDIKAESIGNDRFTMKDIGTMSRRIDELEQHAVLTDVELSVVSKDIVKTNGQDAIKRAVLVDTFVGHSVADVVSDDHRCSIDVERGELRPSFDSHAYDFIAPSAQGITLTKDNILCEVFTRNTDPVVTQSKASKAVRVNPFGLPNWVGSMKVYPHADFWYDKSRRPVVRVNDGGVNDAWLVGTMNSYSGHGSQWNDWESLWTGLSVELTDAESERNAYFFSRSRMAKQSNSAENKWFDNDAVSRKVDDTASSRGIYRTDFRRKGYYNEVATDTLVNKSVVPFVRDNTVKFDVVNLKPGTQVHVFMDNVNMNAYCTMNGASGPFMTNAVDGSLMSVNMNIPAGLFTVGEKIIRVVDDASNDIENATTIAEASFQCSGIRESKNLSVVAIRDPEIRKQTPNSNKVVSTPLYRKKNLNTVRYNQWIDPLAQTFEVNEDLYPNGFFAESVDIHIATADAELPITVELCPVINGLPHTSVILPFSTVTKKPSELTVDEASPAATNFKFSTPVFLAPGEYAILISTNSQNYTVFVANIGETDIETDERISSTFQKGALFRSQNDSEVSGDSNTDLMFSLYRCNFQRADPFNLQVGITGDGINEVSIVQPNIFMFAPSDISISNEITLGSSTYRMVNGRSIPLKNSFDFDTTATAFVEFTIGKTDESIGTFMIDMDRSNLIAVEYIVNSVGSETTVEQAAVSGQPSRNPKNRPRRGVSHSTAVAQQDVSSVEGDDTARYITKYSTIPGDLKGTELKVFLSANIPPNSFIRVFAKTIDSSKVNRELGDTGYQLMTLDSTGEFFAGGQFKNSTNPYDFREASYTLVPSNPFNVFLVKVCMYSNDKTRVPVVKNLRVVAVQ